MNQRFATAAIVILLAGQGLTQALSPAALAIVGTYVSSAGDVSDAARYVLTLKEDGAAGFHGIQDSSRASGNEGRMELTIDRAYGAPTAREAPLPP